ncbi:hypothetical protein ACIA8K_32050 [Catenuloplanes sp. NPDC051500]|uniref:hypothetical protein n=1 Tax=Catenuloplanes sp. NPDC051500 TaxID=3363959 RepID=UPI003798597E
MAPLAVSRRLGHASLQTTSEIYGGLMPSVEEAAVSAITVAMGGDSSRVVSVEEAVPVVIPVRREPSHGAFATGTEEAAYWCGWFAVAGRWDASRVTVEFAERDRGHLARFNVFAGLVSPNDPAAGYVGVRGFGRLLRLTISSARMADDLELSTGGRLMDDRHFWRGVVDGAGWAGLVNGAPRLQVIGSLKLVNGLIYFLKRNGVMVFAQPRPIKLQYRVQLSGRTATAAADVLYRQSSSSLSRRRVVVDEWLERAR